MIGKGTPCVKDTSSTPIQLSPTHRAELNAFGLSDHEIDYPDSMDLVFPLLPVGRSADEVRAERDRNNRLVAFSELAQVRCEVDELARAVVALERRVRA